MISNPIKVGQSIYLRSLNIEDAEGNYCNWLNNPEVNQYLESRYKTWALDEIKAYIENINESLDEHIFAICLLADNSHIGNIKLGPINGIHRFADIGLIIGEKDEWGKGYGTEAIELICQFGFDTLNLDKLIAGCYSNNVGSAKSFLKCGFDEEGRQKNMWRVNDAFQDNLIFGLTREDYYK